MLGPVLSGRSVPCCRLPNSGVRRRCRRLLQELLQPHQIDRDAPQRSVGMVLSVMLNLVCLQSDQQRVQPNRKQTVGCLRQSNPLGNLCDQRSLQPLPTKVTILGYYKSEITTSKQEFHSELSQKLRKNERLGTGFLQSGRGLCVQNQLSKHRENPLIHCVQPPKPFH